MTYEANRIAMTKHFVDNFPTTIIKRANMAFSDDEEEFKIPADEPWLRFIIRNNGSEFQSIGFPSKRVERFGLVMIQVFVQGGTNELDKILDQLVTTFEGVQKTGGLLFKEVNAREIGFQDGWFQTNVTIEFENQESITIVN